MAVPSSAHPPASDAQPPPAPGLSWRNPAGPAGRSAMCALPRPKPFLDPQYCKGCLRCIEACPRDCITPGTVINPATGLVPVELHLENCNGCALCLQACPEPYGLRLDNERPGF